MVERLGWIAVILAFSGLILIPIGFVISPTVGIVMAVLTEGPIAVVCAAALLGGLVVVMADGIRDAVRPLVSGRRARPHTPKS